MLSFINIEVNNLRKDPVLQLKQSNTHLTLYSRGYTCLTSKSCVKSTRWDTRATDSIIKSGQKDNEASILILTILPRMNYLKNDTIGLFRGNSENF